MKSKDLDMVSKIEVTVEKTIEAIERIQRFMMKFGPMLSDNQREQIASKIKELQKLL